MHRAAGGATLFTMTSPKPPQRSASRGRRRPRARHDIEHPPETFGDSDDTFAFIAGFTEGGAPYGITWDEMEANDRGRPDLDEDPSLPF